MAADIIISGIRKNQKTVFEESLTQVFKNWKLPTDDLHSFMKKFVAELSIFDKQALEKYIQQHTNLLIEEQHQALGIVELFAFRSKDLCFAMAQLVDYYASNFSWESSNYQFPFSEGSFILARVPFLELLEWLAVMAIALNPEQETNFDAFSDELVLEALLLIETGYCQKSEEFEFFYTMWGYFNNWRQEILTTDFDYFYWEYSY